MGDATISDETIAEVKAWARYDAHHFAARDDNYRDDLDMVERAFRAYAALSPAEVSRFNVKRAKLDRWSVKPA